MLFMLAGVTLIPGIDTVAKYLQPELSSGQISWSRFLFQLVFLLPLVIMRNELRWPERPVAEFVRGLLIAATTLIFFTSLKVLPVADAIAIFFVEPLILTVLSAVFLGEAIGWRRIAAVVVGFAGALVIIQPSYDVFGVYALLPLAAAVAFSLYLIVTRKLAVHGGPMAMQFNAAVGGLIMMSVALALGLPGDIDFLAIRPAGGVQWLLLALLGLIATTGHLLIVHAFKRAPASVLAPFQYFEIIGATILGFLVFGDVPRSTTWLGMMLIVASGLYVFHRERRAGQLRKD
jgi:RarD protein